MTDAEQADQTAVLRQTRVSVSRRVRVALSPVLLTTHTLLALAQRTRRFWILLEYTGTMDNDNEMNGSDTETTKPIFASSAKGKGKAVDVIGKDVSQDETLPWSASRTYLLLLGLFRFRMRRDAL